MQYALFKKVKAVPATNNHGTMIRWSSLFSTEVEGEAWKEELTEVVEATKKETTHLVFVALVSRPEQVIEHVRKAPLDKYVLFSGEIDEVSVAIPVFVGGKNLATLNSEWTTDDKPLPLP